MKLSWMLSVMSISIPIRFNYNSQIEANKTASPISIPIRFNYNF